MKQLAQLLHAFYEQPLVMPEGLARQIHDVFCRKIAGASFTGSALHAELGIAMPRPRAATRETPAIAVIPIHGLISQHPTMSLGTSIDEIGAQLDAALASSQVDAILLDVDSPGGSVGGVPELAAKIATATERKPIVAYANGLMASAAYWLSAGVDEIVAAPSSLVGSIGVIWVHEDESEALAKEGVRITVVSAGKYKAEGAPWAALTPEAEAHMRNIVDTVYGWFVKAVATGRRDSQGSVISGYGQGRVLLGGDALKAKLVDRIGSFEETAARLAARVQRANRRESRVMGLGAAARARQLALDAEPPVS